MSRPGCLVALGLPSVAIAIYAGTAAARLQSIGAPQRLVLIYAGVAFLFGVSGVGLMALIRRTPEASSDPRRVPAVGNAGTAIFWGFALFWNAIAAPVLVFLPDAIRTGNQLWWLAVLFPIVGLVLLANAIRLTIRALRFRESTLLLETVPAPIGGTLRGHVAVPHPLDAVSAVMIRLTALTQRRRGNTTHADIVALEEREIEPSLLQRIGRLTMIPIEIAVPADAPPSETDVFWRLVVDAEVPGVDYRSTFDVPVERTARTDFRPHGLHAPISAPTNPKSFVERQTPEGRELYFPPFHAPGRAFLSLLVTLAWLGAIVFTVAVDIPSVVTVVLALIAIPIVLNTLELFLESRTILFGPHSVTLRRRMLTKREHVIATDDIASVRTNGVRPSYRVDLETKSGKRITAAKNIRSKREADWVTARTYKPAKL